MPEDNGKENTNESYTNKYQKHVSCNYSYKLVHGDDKFSKLFNSYLDYNVVHNFTNNMLEESEYCSDVIF